jgi:2-iminobutanoate/2-iminopropanoate deaminase
MVFVSTDNAAAVGGHYSQGVVHGGLIFVSGQLAIDPETGEKKPGATEEQVELALKNVVAIVEAAGGRLDTVLKTTVYLSDIELWPRLNETYARFFGDHRPARAVVPVGELPFGMTVEIEAVAAVGE